jgi:peptide chain release factor 2
LKLKKIVWRVFGGLFDYDGRKRRIEEIAHLEASPDFWADPKKASIVLKEKNQSLDVVSPLQKIEKVLVDSRALIEICSEVGEVDDDSRHELQTNYNETLGLLKKLEFQKMLSAETDRSDAYLTIHAGAGGTEACDWAGMLARQYTRYCGLRGFKSTVIDFTDGDGAGYRSVSFEVNGPYAYGFLKAENGIHRLVRISPFDSNARRHTSFASVFVSPILDDTIEIIVRTEDLRVDTYRAGGAGGQHVNKTDSAVRMTHIPTGIVVQCQAERSQIQNREKAMKMLKSRLYELELEKRQAEIDKVNSSKKRIAWGSQIRNYVLQPYQLIKDVRTGHSTSDVTRVLDGELQDFIETFLLQSAEGTLGTHGDSGGDEL